MARAQAVEVVGGDAVRRGIHLVTPEESQELAVAPKRFAAPLDKSRLGGVDAEAVVQESPWLLLSVVAMTVPLTWFLHQLMHRIGI
jgi:hypothetical protein